MELGGVTRFVQRSRVRWVEAQGDYARLHTADGSHLVRVPLTSLEQRWAGAGYPDALAGDAIPLMARIIAVADSFDAMTTDRPYQKGMDFEAAVARVNELKGAAFDERIVESFNRAYRAGEFRDPRLAAAPRPEPAAAPAG